MENQGLGSWLERRRIKSADRTALIFRDERISYQELNNRVNALAHALRHQGVTEGSRVGYVGDNHPAFLEVFFATTMLGAIFVGLNTRLAAPELRYMIEDSGLTHLFHSTALAKVTHSAVEGMESIALVVVDNESDEENSLHSLRAGYSTEYIDVSVSEDQPALILYTSGTTGHPKGAVLLHRNLMWNSFNVLVDYDITSEEVALMISPLFHAAALGMGVFPNFLKGATVILEEGFDAQRVLDLVERYRVTMMSGVPTTYQLLSEHPAWLSTDVSSIRTLTCGGSAVPLRVLEAYEQRGLAFTGGYGLTESSPGATSLQPSFSRPKAGSAGLPHFFVDMRIRNDDDTPTAQGDIGEIQLRGKNVIEQYWNRPEASRATFSDDVWLKTGDLGYVDDQGFLFIADRLKDMIISGGENIYPAEVEQLIFELDQITGAALIGVPDDKWGEAPWVVVTLRPGTSITIEEIRAHLDSRVARYKMPKNLIIVDEFPRTASGKIRKADLRREFIPGA
jgi:fatty-acyl-CoA synthase